MQCSLLIEIIVAVILLAVTGIYFPNSQAHMETMVAGFTMVPPYHYPTFWQRIIYKGVDIYFDFQDTSDNPNMTITLFTSNFITVENSTLTDSYSLPLSNKGHSSCQYLPNEYNMPNYFIKGSSVSGSVFIKPPSDVKVHYAKLYGFSTYLKDVCSKEEYNNLVFSSNLLPGVNQLFHFDNYTLKENSIVYFMIGTIASADILMNLTLIRQFNYYPGPRDLSGHSYRIIDTAGSRHNATITFSPFTRIKYYVSVQDFKLSQSQIGHFVFTLVPRDELKWAIIGVSSFLVILQLFCAVCCGPCWHRFKVWRSTRKTRILVTEETPLIITEETPLIINS